MDDIIKSEKPTELELKDDRLLHLFKAVFEILGLSYGEFNTRFQMNDEQWERLVELKKEYPELVIAKGQSLTLMSLLATTAKIYSGKRFSVLLMQRPDENGFNENAPITGCSLAEVEDGKVNKRQTASFMPSETVLNQQILADEKKCKEIGCQ